MRPFQRVVNQLFIWFRSRQICVLQKWYHCMYPTLGDLGLLYISVPTAPIPMGLVKVEDWPDDT